MLVLGLIVPKRHCLEQDKLAKLTATHSSALEKGETFRCISCQASQKKLAALQNILQLHVPQRVFPAFVSFPRSADLGVNGCKYPQSCCGSLCSGWPLMGQPGLSLISPFLRVNLGKDVEYQIVQGD